MGLLSWAEGLDKALWARDSGYESLPQGSKYLMIILF